MSLSTSAGLPQFRDPAPNTSVALPDPGAGETLDSLDGRMVSHNVLDFLDVFLVKLNAGIELATLSSSIIDAKSCPEESCAPNTPSRPQRFAAERQRASISLTGVCASGLTLRSAM